MKFWCGMVLTLFLDVATRATRVQHTIEDVYTLLSRIDENLRKEDRMREIAQIVRVDATLKSLDKRIGEIAHMLSGDDLGRGLPSDLRSDLRSIDQRIQKVDDTAHSVKTMLSKMDVELRRLEQVELNTNQLERDLEHRLTKLMNAVSSLHEMNKALSNHLRTGNTVEENKSLSSDGVIYLTDSLENLEKTVKEHLSILEVQLKKELEDLRRMTSNALVQCESSEDQENLLRPKAVAGGMSSRQMDFLTANISRSQREIKEEIRVSIDGLEKKLEELSSASGNCAAEETRVGSEVREHKGGECTYREFDSNMRSCAQLRKAGNTCSGVYPIRNPVEDDLFRVYCDMETDGGGWTVLMRRGDYGPPQTFNLPWKWYRVGFGDMNKEFWLGNEYIHLLTNGNETNELRIELESFDNGSRVFTYGRFSIDSQNNEYRMRISGPITGRSTHFLMYKGRPFVTYDRISDQPGDCASKYKGGWWYRKNCIYTDLTGERFVDGTRTSMVGMQSQLWREAGVLKGAELKIRPRNFRDSINF